MPRNFLAQHDFPFRESIRVDRHRNDGGIRPHRQRCRERGCRAEAVEKWGPHAAVAGILVHKHADDSRLAQEGDRRLKSFFSVERRHAQPAAIAVHEFIHERIAKRLIDGPEPRFGNLKNKLGIQFPISDVVDR